MSPQFPPAAPFDRWPGVRHFELPAAGSSLIDRVLCFRHYLRHWLHGRRLDVIQFRSIFEGYPLLSLSPRPALIFEVNGLPSIELKYRYPAAADDRELMRKLVAQERACLSAADRIITPSCITREYLVRARGVDERKVRVVPNGVDPDVFRPAATRSTDPEVHLLYFGTLASWQGVELAIRALEQVCRSIPARLTVVGEGSARQREALWELAAKLHITERLRIAPPMDQRELARHIATSFAVLAPLTPNQRNVVQGCCPLKVLEGMAGGVPVIASGLPVVRELGEDGRHFLLVKPGSVAALVDAVLQLAASPQLCERLGRAARMHIQANHTWQCAGDALAVVYEELGIVQSSTA